MGFWSCPQDGPWILKPHVRLLFQFVLKGVFEGGKNWGHSNLEGLKRTNEKGDAQGWFFARPTCQAIQAAAKANTLCYETCWGARSRVEAPPIRWVAWEGSKHKGSLLHIAHSFSWAIYNLYIQLYMHTYIHTCMYLSICLSSSFTSVSRFPSAHRSHENFIALSLFSSLSQNLNLDIDV